MAYGSQSHPELVYEEKVSSTKTTRLFLALTATFLLLFMWCLITLGSGGLAFLFFGFFTFFLFYSINYRILAICLFADRLKLTFGLFSISIPLDNIENCQVDDLPAGKRLGGAGIHFMFFRRRYRISFNFLEHHRVVIMLKRKIGPVRDVSFSTWQPKEIIYLIKKMRTNLILK